MIQELEDKAAQSDVVLSEALDSRRSALARTEAAETRAQEAEAKACEAEARAWEAEIKASGLQLRAELAEARVDGNGLALAQALSFFGDRSRSGGEILHKIQHPILPDGPLKLDFGF